MRAFDVDCLHCGAGPGEPCNWKSENAKGYKYHKDRIKRAQLLAQRKREIFGLTDGNRSESRWENEQISFRLLPNSRQRMPKPRQS